MRCSSGGLSTAILTGEVLRWSLLVPVTRRRLAGAHQRFVTGWFNEPSVNADRSTCYVLIGIVENVRRPGFCRKIDNQPTGSLAISRLRSQQLADVETSNQPSSALESHVCPARASDFPATSPHACGRRTQTRRLP